MVLKHNIVSQVCPGCDTYLYPPAEVSVIGQEDYEEAFKAPEAEKMITAEELVETNKGRETPLTKEEWETGYKLWAQAFRTEVRARAQARHDDFTTGAPKLKGLRIAEEAGSFKVKGKRWKAVYETIPQGWRLRCPNCNAETLKWERR